MKERVHWRRAVDEDPNWTAEQKEKFRVLYRLLRRRDRDENYLNTGNAKNLEALVLRMDERQGRIEALMADSAIEGLFAGAAERASQEAD